MRTWTEMRPEDFDTSITPTLFDLAPQPLVSTGDDLLSLLADM